MSEAPKLDLRIEVIPITAASQRLKWTVEPALCQHCGQELTADLNQELKKGPGIWCALCRKKQDEDWSDGEHLPMPDWEEE